MARLITSSLAVGAVGEAAADRLWASAIPGNSSDILYIKGWVYNGLNRSRQEMDRRQNV